MSLRALLTPGGPTPRERVDEIFSREMLGSVLVGLAGGKVVEQAVVIAAPARPARLVAWAIAFLLFVSVFAYWEALERRLGDVGEGTGK